jgi:hypothetical protein
MFFSAARQHVTAHALAVQQLVDSTIGEWQGLQLRAASEGLSRFTC